LDSTSVNREPLPNRLADSVEIEKDELDKDQVEEKNPLQKQDSYMHHYRYDW